MNLFLPLHSCARERKPSPDYRCSCVTFRRNWCAKTRNCTRWRLTWSLLTRSANDQMTRSVLLSPMIITYWGMTRSVLSPVIITCWGMTRSVLLGPMIITYQGMTRSVLCPTIIMCWGMMQLFSAQGSKCIEVWSGQFSYSSIVSLFVDCIVLGLYFCPLQLS